MRWPDAARRRFLLDCLGLGLAFTILTDPAEGSGSAPPGGPARYPVPATDGVVIDKDNDVILVRWQGALYAFNRSCPHQHTSLAWREEDSRFQCPKHKSRYQPDGTFISGRATRSMDRFGLRIEGKDVVVDLDTMLRQDQHPAEWAAAVVRPVP